MISYAIDFVLIAALAVTSGCVLTMYRRLRRFDALQGEAAKSFAHAAEALEKARWALASLQSEGDDMAVALAARLNEARMVMNDLESGIDVEVAKQAARPIETGSACPAPAPAPAPPVPTMPPYGGGTSVRRPTLHAEAAQPCPADPQFVSKPPLRWTPPAAAKIRAAFAAADPSVPTAAWPPLNSGAQSPA